MSLLEFIFGRKPMGRHTGSVAMAEVTPLADIGGALASTRLPDFVGGPAEGIPGPSAEDLLAEVVAQQGVALRALRLAAGPQTVLQRVSHGKLDRTASVEARQSAVLARMEIVHDPNMLIIHGQDRSAELVIANRRLMRARFHLDTLAGQVFDFRHDAASEDAAIGCVHALAAFLADPVDLVIEERPASGVFSALGGLAVEDVFFEEDICRAALRLSAEAADEQEAISASVEPAERSAQPYLPPLFLVKTQLAFAEDAPAFAGAGGDRAVG